MKPSPVTSLSQCYIYSLPNPSQITGNKAKDGNVKKSHLDFFKRYGTCFHVVTVLCNPTSSQSSSIYFYFFNKCFFRGGVWEKVFITKVEIKYKLINDEKEVCLIRALDSVSAS